MSATLEIAVESPLWSAVPDLPALVERAVEETLAEAAATGRAEAELSCLFCDDAAMRALNARWRGIDRPTNVLSFQPPPEAAALLLGDIALAFETVEREARRDAKPLEDHVSHLIVHGLLHLLGHDHAVEDEALAMERLEARVMARLGKPDPHAEPDGSDPS